MTTTSESLKEAEATPDIHVLTLISSGMSIFYCSFLFAELPSQVIGKKLGPDVWVSLGSPKLKKPQYTDTCRFPFKWSSGAL